MPRNYVEVFDNISTATPPKTLIGLELTDARQMELYDFMVASRAAPASNAQTYLVGRTTTDGATGTVNTTPIALNPDTPVSVSQTRKAPGTEPVYGASIWEMSLNQQSTYRWVVQPGQGVGLYSAKTTADGLGLKCTANSGTNFNVEGYVYWQE